MKDWQSNLRKLMQLTKFEDIKSFVLVMLAMLVKPQRLLNDLSAHQMHYSELQNHVFKSAVRSLPPLDRSPSRRWSAIWKTSITASTSSARFPCSSSATAWKSFISSSIPSKPTKCKFFSFSKSTPLKDLLMFLRARSRMPRARKSQTDITKISFQSRSSDFIFLIPRRIFCSAARSLLPRLLRTVFLFP